MFGIVWNPILDQCFTARRGHGALNDTTNLLVSNQKEISHALILQDLGSYSDNRLEKIVNIDNIASSSHGYVGNPAGTFTYK